MSKLVGYGAVGGFLAVAYVVTSIDQAINYQEVSARISGIEESCYLEKKESKKTRFTDPMDCELAKALRTAHPAYDGFSIVRNATLHLAYTHPTTNQYTRASLELKRHNGDFQVGKVVQILAHKEEPGKIRKL